MSKTITIRFKDGVPVSNAKDPKTRREAEAFGRAFLAAAKEGRDTLHITAPGPALSAAEQMMASEALAMLPPDVAAEDLKLVRVSERGAGLRWATPKLEKKP